jgi:hypothetical protein
MKRTCIGNFVCPSYSLIANHRNWRLSPNFVRESNNQRYCCPVCWEQVEERKLDETMRQIKAEKDTLRRSG